MEQGVELLALPLEVQRSILACCLHANLTALLQTCHHIHDVCIPLLYTDIRLTTLSALELFVTRLSGARRHSPRWTTSLTVHLPGVPGGGGSELNTGVVTITSGGGKRRLLLAAQALQLCPMVETVSIEMYGVRHSPLLAEELIEAEYAAFKGALASLGRLRHLHWITPESARFVGFSVAVVDQIFEPLVEGLYDAAMGQEPLEDERNEAQRKIEGVLPDEESEGEEDLDDDDDKREGEEDEEEEEEWDLQQEELEEAAEDLRLRHESATGQVILTHTDRRPLTKSHPLETIELHHVQFAADRGRRLFGLLADSEEPEGQGKAYLFRRLKSVTIRSAINVAPKGPAYLALVWELRSSPYTQGHDAFDKDEDDHEEDGRPRKILLADAFLSSIWGDRVSIQSIRQEIETLVAAAVSNGATHDHSVHPLDYTLSTSKDPYVRSLENSLAIDQARQDSKPHLSSYHVAQLAPLQEWQRREVIQGAVDRVEIITIEKAIAGSIF